MRRAVSDRQLQLSKWHPLQLGHSENILHINIEDVAVTRDIIAAGQLLDIDVLDHLIIGRQQFVSMKERGLAFE